ncbi:MAG: bifunctional N-acetylglucosamine-1-phosphate uridyltransferase/glucosamine-1-phosphate acetyltransferase [Dethiobacteria bacterium]
MKQLWAVVLAAGEGKRMYSSLPKVLHSLCGRPMLDYVLNSAADLTTNIVVVVGHGASLIEEKMGDRWIYALQEQQLGTGHAVLQAFNRLPNKGTLLVLCGDTPLLTGAHLKTLVDIGENCAAVVGTVKLENPTGYGRIVRGDEQIVERIVEEKDASEVEKSIKEINIGTYCFNLQLLRHYLPLLTNENAQGEYYLTDVIGMLRLNGYPVKAFEIEDHRFGLGINNRMQLAEAVALMQERINSRLMLEGVTIEDPATTYIEPDVKVGVDTIIRPSSIIEAGTVIGSGCIIGPFAHLRNAVIEDGSVIESSYVENCKVKNGSRLGPYEVMES